MIQYYNMVSSFIGYASNELCKTSLFNQLDNVTKKSDFKTNELFWEGIIGCPQKTFRCPIKSFLKSVSFVELYLIQEVFWGQRIFNHGTKDRFLGYPIHTVSHLFRNCSEIALRLIRNCFPCWFRIVSLLVFGSFQRDFRGFSAKLLRNDGVPRLDGRKNGPSARKRRKDLIWTIQS